MSESELEPGALTLPGAVDDARAERERAREAARREAAEQAMRSSIAAKILADLWPKGRDE